MYISTTAALYSKMYSFGMTSFQIYVNTNCSAYCLNISIRDEELFIILCQNFMMLPLVLYPPPPILRLCIALLRSPKGGCCSISDDLSCSFNYISKGGKLHTSLYKVIQLFRTFQSFFWSCKPVYPHQLGGYRYPNWPSQGRQYICVIEKFPVLNGEVTFYSP